MSDNTCSFWLCKLLLGHSQLVRIQAAILGKNWPTCGLNDVFGAIGWRPNQLESFSQRGCQARKSDSNLLRRYRLWQMAARSQWNASGCRETNGCYLVWVGAGLLAVVGGSSPSVVEETPLVALMALAWCLVPAAVAALANVLLCLAEASVATTLGVGVVRQQRVASVVIAVAAATVI